MLATGAVDLAPPAAPANLHVTGEAANQLSVAWNAVAGASGYDVYVSPLSGGGYVKANESPVAGTSFTIDGLPNAVPAYVVGPNLIFETQDQRTISAVGLYRGSLPNTKPSEEQGWAHFVTAVETPCI